MHNILYANSFQLQENEPNGYIYNINRNMR